MANSAAYTRALRAASGRRAGPACPVCQHSAWSPPQQDADDPFSHVTFYCQVCGYLLTFDAVVLLGQAGPALELIAPNASETPPDTLPHEG